MDFLSVGGPIAARFFCVASNIRKLDGVSAWNQRHGRECNGLRYPFGALAHYLPPKPYLEELPKLAPRAIPGLFLGYVLAPGAHFRGDYLVASISDIGKQRPLIHRVKEVTVPEDSITFIAATSHLSTGAETDVPLVPNADLFDQGRGVL